MKNYKSEYLFKFLILLLLLLSWSSAEVFGRDEESNRPLVDDKYRLSKDREELEKLRQQIPEEKRKENDEVAFTLGLMSELRFTPAEVRERFNTALRKKRDLFNKDMKKYREDFNRDEKSGRTAFVKELETERKEMRGQKLSAEKRKENSEKLESKRKEFYSEQKDKREEFEAKIREQRKNFEDYAREKTNDFNQEHRAYAKRYSDFKKEKEEERKSSQHKSDDTKASQLSTTNQQAGTKVVNPSVYGITKEDLEKAFQDAQSIPARKLEPGE